MNEKTKKVILWIAKLIPAIFLLQTLVIFKFPGHPDSIEIFTQLDLLGLPENFGRIGTGIAELIAVILLLIPKTQKIGAAGIIVLMIGALISHVTKLGFEGKNLELAIMAIILIACSAYVLFATRKRK